MDKKWDMDCMFLERTSIGCHLDNVLKLQKDKA